MSYGLLIFMRKNLVNIGAYVPAGNRVDKANNFANRYGEFQNEQPAVIKNKELDDAMSLLNHSKESSKELSKELSKGLEELSKELSKRGARNKFINSDKNHSEIESDKNHSEESQDENNEENDTVIDENEKQIDVNSGMILQ